MTLADRARQSRASGVVLQVQISNLRSRDAQTPIIVFEGSNDVGPYEVWISRMRPLFHYLPLAAAGKSQVLDYRRRTLSHRSIANVYLVVDRDFDALRNQTNGPDIFCTDAYSVENYLVTDSVLASLLRDELRCTDPDDVERAEALYARLRDEFHGCIREANRRIFRASRLGIAGKGLDERISKYVEISWNDVRPAAVDLPSVIRLAEEPDVALCEEIDAEFGRLDPPWDYRGKFLLSFFLRWIELLSAVRDDATKAVFKSSGTSRLNRPALTLRSLATRSGIPAGLDRFIMAIS